jgi:hypothetical protein
MEVFDAYRAKQIETEAARRRSAADIASLLPFRFVAP